eukprot:g19647.t1
MLSTASYGGRKEEASNVVNRELTVAERAFLSTLSFLPASNQHTIGSTSTSFNGSPAAGASGSAAATSIELYEDWEASRHDDEAFTPRFTSSAPPPTDIRRQLTQDEQNFLAKLPFFTSSSLQRDANHWTQAPRSEVDLQSSSVSRASEAVSASSSFSFTDSDPVYLSSEEMADDWEASMLQEGEGKAVEDEDEASPGMADRPIEGKAVEEDETFPEKADRPTVTLPLPATSQGQPQQADCAQEGEWEKDYEKDSKGGCADERPVEEAEEQEEEKCKAEHAEEAEAEVEEREAETGGEEEEGAVSVVDGEEEGEIEDAVVNEEAGAEGEGQASSPVEGEAEAAGGLFGTIFDKNAHAASSVPSANIRNSEDDKIPVERQSLCSLGYDPKKWTGSRPVDMLRSWCARKQNKCKAVKIKRLGAAIGGPGVAAAVEIRFQPPRLDLVICSDGRPGSPFLTPGGTPGAKKEKEKEKEAASAQEGGKDGSEGAVGIAKQAAAAAATPRVFVKTAVEAEDWVATRAIFLLSDPANRALENRFPPPFRAEWRAWRKQLEEQQNQAAEAKLADDEENVHAPRRKFMEALLADLKSVCSPRTGVGSRQGSSSGRPGVSRQGLARSGPADRAASSSRKTQAPRSQQDKLSSKQCWAQAQLDFQERVESAAYLKMLPGRQELPVYAFRQQILKAVAENDVCVISGETGSGKSTQVPQFLLEAGLHPQSGSSLNDDSVNNVNIIVTQPRRISAVSLATRVSQELGEAGPGVRNSLVGYRIRLDSKKAPTCRVLYCTTGILLRMLQGESSDSSSGGLEGQIGQVGPSGPTARPTSTIATSSQKNPLAGVTHVVLDEVHERGLESDFLLLLLRRLQAQQCRDAERQGLPSRAAFKLVLMSATIEAHKICAYFPRAASLVIPGRLFPVEVKYAEEVVEMIDFQREEEPRRVLSDEAEGKEGFDELWDYQVDLDLIQALLHWLHRQAYDAGGFSGAFLGAILVFLPGLDSIKALLDKLLGDPIFGDEDFYKIYALHSALGNTQAQADVFDWPRPGLRKIVLATNIAETGVTIPDVVFVIDSGRHKEMSYDSTSRMSRLTERFCSQANAKQRAGRAGRVQAGFCFRLYSRRRFDSLDPYPTPEMERSPLVELCLHVLSMPSQHDAVAFLSEALSPPPAKAVHQALERLERVGAVVPMSPDELEELSVNSAEERALTQSARAVPTDTHSGGWESDAGVTTNPAATAAEDWEEEVTEQESNKQAKSWYRLTALGQHLARMPVDVGVGRMLIYAVVLRCLHPVLVVAAALSASRSIFLAPLDAREQARKAQLKFAQQAALSDQLTISAAYFQWQEALSAKKMGLGPGGATFCREHFLHEPTLRLIHRLKLDLLRVLATAGFVRIRTPPDSPALNLYSNHKEVVKAVIAAGLYPNVFSITHLRNKKEQQIARNLTGSALIAAKKATQQVQIAEGALRRPVSVHPASYFRDVENVAIAFNPKLQKFCQTHYYGVYHSKVKTSRAFLRDVTLLAPYALLLFGGSSGGIQVHHTHAIVSVDSWIHINCAPRLGVLLLLLRNRLNDYLQEIFRTPNMESQDESALPLIDAIAALLSS